MNNMETKKEITQETIEKLLNKYGENNSVAYYYDADEEKILQGKLVLPHNMPQELRHRKILYIGNQKDFDFYTIKLGIKHFYSNGGETASVGFNPDTNEYFGWSHRGYGKFYIGYKVKKGSMLAEQIAEGYTTKTLQHCKVLAHIFADLMD